MLSGGDGTWREFLTLPNILKVYNPNLRGFSTGTGEWLTKNAKLNVAFPVASDEDAFKQAKVVYSIYLQLTNQSAVIIIIQIIIEFFLQKCVMILLQIGLFSQLYH